MSLYAALLIAACGGSPPPTPPTEAVAPPAAPSRPTIAPLPPMNKPAKRDPDCQISAELDPHLAPQQGDAQVAVTKTIGQTIESFTHPDGTPVRYGQGGCVHYGMTLTVGLASRPDDPYAEAVRQADRVAFVEGSTTLRDLLRAAGSIDEQGYFSCGDATCSVRVAEDDGSLHLIIGYDFPL